MREWRVGGGKVAVICICSTYEGRRGAYRIMLGRPEGRRPLGRTRHRWEGHVKIDL